MVLCGRRLRSQQDGGGLGEDAGERAGRTGTLRLERGWLADGEVIVTAPALRVERGDRGGVKRNGAYWRQSPGGNPRLTRTNSRNSGRKPVSVGPVRGIWHTGPVPRQAFLGAPGARITDGSGPRPPH